MSPSVVLLAVALSAVTMLLAAPATGEEWTEALEFSDQTLSVTDDLLVAGNASVNLRDCVVNLAGGNLTIAGELHLEASQLLDLGTVELLPGGSLELRNSTLAAVLQVVGGSADLWNATLPAVENNGGVVRQGWFLQGQLLGPFGSPLTGGAWVMAVGGLQWEAYGSLGAGGETGWVAVPTSFSSPLLEATDANVTLVFDHLEGHVTRSVTLDRSWGLVEQLELELLVEEFRVVGSDTRLVNELFELRVRVLNSGTSNLEMTATLSVVDPQTLTPLEGSDGALLAVSQLLRIEQGETATMSLTGTIPRAGIYLCYYRLFVEHLVLSPSEGEAELVRAGNASPFETDEILVLLTTNATQHTIRAPHAGVQKESYIESTATVAQGEQLMLVELDFGSSSRTIGIVSPPTPPEELLGLEYRYWAVILPLLVMGGAYSRERQKLGTYRVEEVFLLDTIGRVIAHAGTDDESGLDEDIVGSMLQALQDFVAESFRSEGESLRRLEHGELLLVIERGRQAVLVLVLRGQERPEIREQLQLALDRIEREYGPTLERWDGDSSAFAGASDIVESLIGIRESVTWNISPGAIVRSVRDRLGMLLPR